MSNWDFVVAYDSQATDWLSSQGLPHPPVRSGNRLPSTAEVLSAWQHVDVQQLVLIDGYDWDDDNFVPNLAIFKLKGDRLVALRVLVVLCERCGQLWMYPDTGEPAIVVDSIVDPEQTLRVHAKAGAMENSWKIFYEQMYGT
jgi:hypothetical protein